MTDNPRSISVTGSGSAEAAPDLLTLSIGVECRRETVAEAYGDAGRVGRHHVGAPAERRGQRGHPTSGLNVRAEVNWQEGRGQIVTGYLASSMLTIRIRSLSGSSEIIAAAVAAGGDDVRLNGLEPRLRRSRRRRGPGPRGRLAGCPHHGRALRRPRRRRPGQGTVRSPSRSATRRPSRWRRCSGRWQWNRSPWRPASRASAPQSASCGNCSTEMHIAAARRQHP